MTTAASPAFEVDHDAALDRLVHFLAVPGITPGGLDRAGDRRALAEAGVPDDAMVFDDANTRIPSDTNRQPHREVAGDGQEGRETATFMTHMDTVPLCAGAKPKVQGTRVVNENEGTTALGGDNRTGCAVPSRSSRSSHKLPHSPLTLLLLYAKRAGFSARSTSTRPISVGLRWGST